MTELAVLECGKAIKRGVAKQDRITPKYDQAIRYYASTGQDLRTCAAVTKTNYDRLSCLINSPQGERVIAEVRGNLDNKFEALYEKVIDTLKEGLEHPEPQVALASANLWLRHAKGTKVEVTLSAEDLVQKIMRGEDS